MCGFSILGEALWEHDMKPTQGLGGFHSCHAWAFPCQTPCWWWMQDLIRETSISVKFRFSPFKVQSPRVVLTLQTGEKYIQNQNHEATVADIVKPGVLMYLYTCVISTVFALVVSVLPAAASLLQAGTGLSAVTGPLLYVADTHSHWGLAGFGTAAPNAPVAHCTVLGWMLAPTLCEKHYYRISSVVANSQT